MAKALYKITLTNWLEHNPGKKNTYKKTLIANNLITDAKVLALPLSHRWLFINLLLICGDYASDTVTLNEQQLNDILTARVGCENALYLLQSLQLVTFEKVLLKKEVKKERSKERKEEKGIEPTSSDSASNSEIILFSPKAPKEIVAEVIFEFWNSFSNLPKVTSLSPGRKSKIASRLKQSAFQTGWREIITTISQNPFLTGTNDRGWRARFDWFISNDENYLKVIEGFYTGNQPKKAMSAAQKTFEGLRDQAQRVAAGEL